MNARTALFADRVPSFATRNGLARAFSGLNWKRFGVFCLIVGLWSAFQLLFMLLAGHLAPRSPLAMTWVFVALFGAQLARFTPALLAGTAVDNLTSRDAPLRAFRILAAVILGVLVGTPFASIARSSVLEFLVVPQGIDLGSLRTYAGDVIGHSAVAAIGVALYIFVVRDAEGSASLHQEELARIGLDRQMAEARLQLMQAQIEPHFLFNTLASVRRLYETDPRAGRAMLQDLVSYLRAALPQLRESRSTLGSELALTNAYLNVQKIRMGKRIEVEIDVPRSLESASFPPMMVVTLVENAIKHGLAPLPEGGRVRISARAAAGQLRVTVDDTGRGLGESSGSGVGLANIRERLAARFGSAAQLVLRQNLPRGASVAIEVPFAVAAPGAAA